MLSSYKADEDFLDTLAFDKGLCIEVVQKEETVYISNSFNRGCMIGEQGKNTIAYKRDFIDSGEEKKNYKLINPRFSNKTLVSALKLEEGLYVFVSASLEPLDSSILLLKKQFIYVSLLVLALSFLIGYFISRKISGPMEKIGKGAKKMAKGDYNIVFDTESDIKELAELSKTLSYTRDELSKTDELRRELLANVGHDLKTPLTMIKAYAEMVRDLSYGDAEKREKHLNTIIEETDRLNLLVGDILDLSKMQSSTLELHKTEFDLHVLIQNVLKRYEILKETEKYKFIYENKKEIWIEADYKRMEQVLYNLINNALQYTGADHKVYILIEEKEKECTISIKDTGKGIKKEEEKYIWDKYYHSKQKHQRNAVGTGLGLSIVKNILEMHAYSYGVKSSPNGTTFYFNVPKK